MPTYSLHKLAPCEGRPIALANGETISEDRAIALKLGQQFFTLPLSRTTLYFDIGRLSEIRDNSLNVANPCVRNPFFNPQHGWCDNLMLTSKTALDGYEWQKEASLLLGKFAGARQASAHTPSKHAHNPYIILDTPNGRIATEFLTGAHSAPQLVSKSCQISLSPGFPLRHGEDSFETIASIHNQYDPLLAADWKQTFNVGDKEKPFSLESPLENSDLRACVLYAANALTCGVVKQTVEILITSSAAFQPSITLRIQGGEIKSAILRHLADFFLPAGVSIDPAQSYEKNSLRLRSLVLTPTIQHLRLQFPEASAALKAASSLSDRLAPPSQLLAERLRTLNAPATLVASASRLKAAETLH